MKKYTVPARGTLQTIVNGETSVPGLQKIPKPYDEDSMVRKRIEQLTSREIQVLLSVAEGKLIKQAASELSISIKTVEKHREHIMDKLGIRGIAGLTHFAIYTGIIQCNPQLVTA